MTIKIHHLRDLLAIVEKGSIRSAATYLGVAQPSLSRSIRELEKDLGVPLFERRAQGSFLTPMGVLFARRANAAVSELRRGREEIEQIQGDTTGTVVACLSSLTHVALMPAIWKPFRERYPNLQLSVIEGVYPMVEARLKNGTIDFYVGPAPESGMPAGLQMEKLFDNSRIVLARKGHPLAKATSLAELTEVDWVTTSITDKAETEFSDLFLRHGLPAPRLALQGESALTWITALISTDFLAISPRQWADSPVISNLLEQVHVKESLMGASIVLMQRAAIPLTPAAEHLSNLIRRAAAHVA
ncbi:MAG: LysR substrate-binding domain-containing protein [Pseudomonadota bacterium]